jgi:hypothetical protein
MVEVVIGYKGLKLVVLVDTGCTPGICFLKDQVKDLDIEENLGVKMNEEVSSYVTADGNIVGGDDYYSWVQIKDEKQVVKITVIDPQKILGHEEPTSSTPLLGREFLDHYNLTFKGKEKRLELSK